MKKIFKVMFFLLLLQSTQGKLNSVQDQSRMYFEKGTWKSNYFILPDSSKIEGIADLLINILPSGSISLFTFQLYQGFGIEFGIYEVKGSISTDLLFKDKFNVQVQWTFTDLYSKQSKQDLGTMTLSSVDKEGKPFPMAYFDDEVKIQGIMVLLGKEIHFELIKNQYQVETWVFFGVYLLLTFILVFCLKQYGDGFLNLLNSFVVINYNYTELIIMGFFFQRGILSSVKRHMIFTLLFVFVWIYKLVIFNRKEEYKAYFSCEHNCFSIVGGFLLFLGGYKIFIYFYWSTLLLFIYPIFILKEYLK